MRNCVCTPTDYSEASDSHTIKLISCCVMRRALATCDEALRVRLAQKLLWLKNAPKRVGNFSLNNVRAGQMVISKASVTV